MLAHIRNGALIKTYSDEKGWVDLEDGQRASPPVAGFVSGPDKVVPVVSQTIDNSTQSDTTQSRWTLVEENQVVMGTTISSYTTIDFKHDNRQFTISGGQTKIC